MQQLLGDSKKKKKSLYIIGGREMLDDDTKCIKIYSLTTTPCFPYFGKGFNFQVIEEYRIPNSHNKKRTTSQHSIVEMSEG